MEGKKGHCVDEAFHQSVRRCRDGGGEQEEEELVVVVWKCYKVCMYMYVCMCVCVCVYIYI